MILFTHSFFVFKIVTETNKSTYLFNYYFFFLYKEKKIMKIPSEIYWKTTLLGHTNKEQQLFKYPKMGIKKMMHHWNQWVSVAQPVCCEVFVPGSDLSWVVEGWSFPFHKRSFFCNLFFVRIGFPRELAKLHWRGKIDFAEEVQNAHIAFSPFVVTATECF